jgi:hypothetical protein
VNFNFVGVGAGVDSHSAAALQTDRDLIVDGPLDNTVLPFRGAWGAEPDVLSGVKFVPVGWVFRGHYINKDKT